MKVRALAHGNAPQARFLRNNTLVDKQLTFHSDENVDFSDENVDLSDEQLIFLVVRGGQGRSGGSLEVPGGACSLKYV